MKYGCKGSFFNSVYRLSNFRTLHCVIKNVNYICTRFSGDCLSWFRASRHVCREGRRTTEIEIRAISSVGSEHLPYKQGVVGSIPTSPTEKGFCRRRTLFFRFRVMSSEDTEALI